MYPTLSELIQDLFGVSISIPFQTYGILLVLALLSSYMVVRIELLRKINNHTIGVSLKKKRISKISVLLESLLILFIGFLIGYKGFYIFTHYSQFVADTKMMIRLQGSVLGGVLGLFFGLFYLWKNQYLKIFRNPTLFRTITPKDHANNMLLLAAFFGLLGTKIFADLEHWKELIVHPIQTITTNHGISFLGGLIFGAFAVFLYAKKNSLPIIQLTDIAALAIPIAYAIGRMGCQISGDGCWGVYNEAYAAKGSIPIKSYELGQVASFKPPASLSFLPDWLFAYNYPHNVLQRGSLLENCTWEHCHVLESPVFPTPLYETILMLLLFFVLWSLRKRIKTPGILFSVYLICAGFERFFIEKIRLNKAYDVWGFSLTQAQIISIGLVGVGFLLLFSVFYFSKKKWGNRIIG